MALLALMVSFLVFLVASANAVHPNKDDKFLPGIKLPSNFQAVENCLHPSSYHDHERIGHKCGNGKLASSPLPSSVMKLSMKHRDAHPLHWNKTKSESFHHAMRSDSSRLLQIQSRRMYTSILTSTSSRLNIDMSKNSSGMPSPSATTAPHQVSALVADQPSHISSQVESGITLGSGEYFMDVYIGTPPKPFSLIIDTGSDLIWTQCSPCKNCYQQQGPVFSPIASSSYKLLTCGHPQCGLVYNDDNCTKGQSQTCKYAYWYGDKSNTTGDLSLEAITLNLDNGQPYRVEGIVFGCGHSNEGLFTGAGGLLGLGKGPLSFPSQMQNRFRHKFSYCLVSRNNNLNVSSSLTFGEDESLVNHPQIQYTRFVNYSSTETYYYLAVKSVLIGGEELDIPSTAWALDGKDQYGAIIDSGSTLTYFVKLAYEKITHAFNAKISYPKVNSTLLQFCYNLSGYEEAQFPTFSIVFGDGAVLSPPVENYIIEIDSVMPTYCIAVMEAPPTIPNILGNYLQQNIHFLYDLENNRLGFAPMDCTSMAQF